MTTGETKPETGGRMSLRILVAEDSPLNQQVVLKQLEVLGYRAVAVADGAKALVAFLSGSFNVILMDCQMPEMSGYEATWQIREREKQRVEEGKTVEPIYIIAMTANTEADNRQRCLDAGMNDFMHKPVQLPELEAVLVRALGNRASSQELDAIIDPVIIAGLRQLRKVNEPDPLPSLIDLFLRETPTHFDRISEAIVQNDLSSLARVISDASALKGSAGNLGARNLAALADEIVQAARLGFLSEAAPVLERARKEFDRVRAALEKIKVLSRVG